jgi:hypothetical protein
MDQTVDFEQLAAEWEPPEDVELEDLPRIAIAVGCQVLDNLTDSGLLLQPTCWAARPPLLIEAFDLNGAEVRELMVEPYPYRDRIRSGFATMTEVDRIPWGAHRIIRLLLNGSLPGLMMPRWAKKKYREGTKLWIWNSWFVSREWFHLMKRQYETPIPQFRGNYEERAIQVAQAITAKELGVPIQ